MGLYQRSGIYWFSIQYMGKRIYKPTGTGNKKLAEKIYAKVLTEITEEKYFDTAKLKQIAFDEMVTKYLKEHEKQRDAATTRVLKSFFSEYTLHQISSRKITEYRSMRLRKVKPATVYQELALMRRMFNVAIREWEWTKYNPVSKLSFSVGNKNARDRWLSDAEEDRLLCSATNPWWLKNFLNVALHTGMRRGEILNLKWDDVDMRRKILLVVKSKNGEKRAIPINNTLYNTLDAIKVRDISGKVFPISRSSVRHAFDKTVEKAGIEDFRLHDCRHTFATRLVQRGCDLYRVSKLLGHKTLAMTMRYAHHYPESLRSSVELLDECDKSVTMNAVNFGEVQKTF